ncbi:MAG: hypothetical protein IJO89_04080, partial [Clostridia bacterium]|nr:hypothetical protein [Clostridia bacterium]
MLTKKRIISLILALAVITGTALVPANASSDSVNADFGFIDMGEQAAAPQNRFGSAEKREMIVADEDYHRDMIMRSSGTYFSTRNSVSEWDFSTHFGYDYLGYFDNGEIMQAVYADLYA